MTSTADSTNGLYETCIRIMNNASVDFMDPDATLKWISENKKSKNTQKNYVCSVQYALKKIDGTETIRKSYTDKISKLAKSINSEYLEQRLSHSEESKYETWDIISGYGEKIFADTEILETDKLLAGLYLQMPPVRLDYVNLGIFDARQDPDIGNYVVVNKKEAYVVINNHKSAKSHGTIVNQMPKILAKRFRAFIKLNPSTTKLFEMTEKTLSKKVLRLFAKYTKKKIGVGVLRHSYISHFLDKAPSLKKCELLAKQMGHSLTLQSYYRRILKSEESSAESDTDSDEE